MAQDLAAEMTAPRPWLVYAWIDATLHPKFATFQRWFPLMKAPWRRISLAVSLILILLNVYAHGALDIFNTYHQVQIFSLSGMFSYFVTPRGLFRAFFYGPCSILTLFAMPAAVAVFSPRSIGPYAIRFKRIFRPWMQVQPTICALLLFSTVAELFLTAVGIYNMDDPLITGIAFIGVLFASFLSLALVPIPALATFSYTIVTFSAGSSLSQKKTCLIVAIPGILVLGVFWDLLALILNLYGYHVL
jgi:hypothetical protein